ncbi:zinc ribbon domain-containing protein [Eubacteriaceae bacterium ES3]|nr:zinc ribbon domain-containing protein [Eubacteriaceae bacterium ES3]
MTNQNTPIVGSFAITKEELGFLAGQSNELLIYEKQTNLSVQTEKSESLNRLLASPHAQTISYLLNEPDLRLRFHTGGGASMEEIFYVFLSQKNQMVLANFTDSEGQIKLILFAGWEAFLNWWIDIYCTEDNNNYREIFHGQEDPETIICAFYCLDLYRRAVLESLLSHQRVEEIELTSRDFILGLKNEILSNDVRWLMPAFIALTPGMKSHKLVLSAKHLEQIESLGFVKKKNEDGQEVLLLDDLSKSLGTELMTAWIGVAGIEAVGLINGKKSVLDRKSVIPTAFTNHLLSLENEAGNLKLLHQALSSEYLRKMFEQWRMYLGKIVGGGQSQTEEKAVAHFCGKCGNPLKEAANFCPKCGTPVK